MIRIENNVLIPEGYQPKLNLRNTSLAIKLIKDHAETQLADSLNLMRVSAPLFVDPKTGLNDNLNGVERPVSFAIKGTGEEVEVVHSLAKWKRLALANYKFDFGEGIYTDMNAIRRDEIMDNLHSIYVDQWDWEKILKKEERTIDYLKKTVREIFACLRRVENLVRRFYPELEKKLPADVYFITAEELLQKYPNLSQKARENEICREKKAVFIIGIGDKLSDGQAHDGRAPDYDDWTLNGDLLFWYPLLDRAIEISSMGIRVDEDSLKKQLQLANCEGRETLAFHQGIFNKVLPYTIGGGIGQSRLCMFFLDKAHIGEVHVSIWPAAQKKLCQDNQIYFL